MTKIKNDHVPCREYAYKKVRSGDTVGRLTVLEKSDKRSKNGSILWICVCECGNKIEALSSSLNNGLKQSCGCLNSEMSKVKNSTHGKSRSREYNSWLAMRQRCYYEHSDFYEDYGGRGIKVCDRWIDSFENFYDDMGDCPKGYSLDRKDVNLGYSKENCQWSSNSFQGFNTRKHKNNTSGRTGVVWNKCVNKWVAYIGVDNKSIHLGCFDSKEDAIIEREKAEIKYFNMTKE